MFKRVLLFTLATPFASAGAAQSLSQSAPPSSQPSVSVPREVLERYVGRYALNGTIATVSLTDGNRLSVELMGQPKGPPLRAVGANEFVADAAGVHIFFDGDGPKASRLRSRYAGSEASGMRIADNVAVPANGPPVDETLVPYANAEDSIALPDGRRLHVVCMGKGSPTVILTAGAGDFAGAGWGTIQPEMAKITRTCAWDRSGFGLSDGTMAEVNSASTTADLEAALATGMIAGPYVMVGHSLGSFETLMYTDQHPDKVVGMVLVDPSIPDQFARLRPGQPAPAANDPLVQRFRKCAADIRAGTVKADGPDPDRCFAYPPTWPPALRQALIKKVGNPVQYEAMASYLTNSALSTRQAINPSRNYRNMPLIVLAAVDRFALPPGAPPLTDEQKAQMAAADAVMSRGQAELAALSTRGAILSVPGANHYIQRTKPQTVLDAVAKVVGEARASSR
jgi:pimeloyl-ACP methyl ester carboxylesterase